MSITTPTRQRLYTQVMEQLQEGYVAAVAASAGVIAEFRRRDVHKFDVELSRQPDIAQEEVAVRIQLKSTTQIKPDPADTSFPFRFKTRPDFESLAMPRTVQPHILVVMVVGKDQSTWAEADQERLWVSHCCYWVSLAGQVAPPKPEQPVVQVPTSNIFDAAALTEILDRIERGDPL